MFRKCYICGKTAACGRTFSRKGLIKAKGGTGSKISRVNRRKFHPNLQKVRALVKGKLVKINACTKCLKAGKVVKA